MEHDEDPREVADLSSVVRVEDNVRGTDGSYDEPDLWSYSYELDEDDNEVRIGVAVLANVVKPGRQGRLIIVKEEMDGSAPIVSHGFMPYGQSAIQALTRAGLDIEDLIESDEVAS